MRSYRFRYLHGQSMPYQSLDAADDADFAAKVAAWEKATGFTHIPSTVTSGCVGGGEYRSHKKAA